MGWWTASRVRGVTHAAHRSLSRRRHRRRHRARAYKSSAEWVERPSSKYLIPQVTPVQGCLGPRSKYDECRVARGKEVGNEPRRCAAGCGCDPNVIAAKLQIGLGDVTTASATTRTGRAQRQTKREGKREQTSPWQRLRVRPVRAHRSSSLNRQHCRLWVRSCRRRRNELTKRHFPAWFMARARARARAQLCTVINRRRKGAIWRQSSNWTIWPITHAHTHRAQIRLTFEANSIAVVAAC